MKFNLLDKIEQIDDQRIVAVKQVSLAEEYLADHFPTFPVLPGVMMLEACIQAAGWILHRRLDFSRSIIVLKEARNVKYGNFVAPGNSMRVEAELTRATEDGGIFKMQGIVNGSQIAAISAKIELVAFNLERKQPELAELDEKLRRHNRERWMVLSVGNPSGRPAAQTAGAAQQI